MTLGLQTNCGPLLKILGAQPEILGAHTVNQHANQIFIYLQIFTVVLINILITDTEITMCCSVSHFIVILIYPKGFQVYVHAFDEHVSVSFTGVCHLDRTLSLLSACSPLHWECIIMHDKRLPREKPFMASKAESCTGSSDPHNLDETGWVGRQLCDCVRDFSGAEYVNQERRSEQKPSTVDDVLFLHSNL